MKPDLSFENMLRSAKFFPGLALATSFIQVEYGVRELEGHWRGFVDSLYDSEKNESNELALYNSFTEGLEDYIEMSLSAPY